MTDVPSPTDVEDVVESITETATESLAVPLRRDAGTYDFSHPDLLSRDQSRALRTVHDGYAQALAKRLSTELLSNATASVASVDHVTYAEFLMLLPAPTVLAVIDVQELEGKVAMELSPSLAFLFVDRLLGGAGGSLEKPRALTSIEQGLVQRVLQKACRELDAMWHPIHELHFHVASIEGNPELARVVNPEEMTVLISIELMVNDVHGTMNLCLPYVVMEPAIHRLGQGTTYTRAAGADEGAIREALGATVVRAPVSIDADLGTVRISLRDLLDLEVGDVLRLNPASPDGARVLVQGQTRLDGVPGQSNGHRAFRVTDVRTPSPGKRGE